MKKTPKRLKNCFTIHVKNERDYSHATIFLLEPRPYGSSDHRTIAELSWQANAGERGNWYGMHVKTDLCAFDGGISARAKAFAKLSEKLFPENESTDIFAVLERLGKLGIPRVAHEGRLGRYIEMRDAISLTAARFMDDWRAYAGRDGCSCATVAESPEAAQAGMTLEWSADIAEGSGFSSHANIFAAWVAAGKPVRRDEHARPAEFPDIDTLCNKPTAAPAPVEYSIA